MNPRTKILTLRYTPQLLSLLLLALSSPHVHALPPLPQDPHTPHRVVELNQMIDPVTARSPHLTSALVLPRTPPPGGRRETVRDVIVISDCDKIGCTDALHDLTYDLTYSPRLPIESATDSSRERVIRIADVSPRYVSVYLGGSVFNGGAHANNHLECATFERASGERLSLPSLSPLIAIRALEAFKNISGDAGLHSKFSPDSFRFQDGKIIMCAITPDVSGNVIVEYPIP